jgi:hypothetical protein
MIQDYQKDHLVREIQYQNILTIIADAILVKVRKQFWKIPIKLGSISHSWLNLKLRNFKDRE